MENKTYLHDTIMSAHTSNHKRFLFPENYCNQSDNQESMFFF